MAIPSREDIGKQRDRLVVNQPVIGKNMRIVKIEGPSAHIRSEATGLANQENARGNVPGMQAKLPEHIQSPAGHIGQIERGSSGPAHPVRQHRELIKEVDVHVLVASARGKAGGHQRVLHPVHLGYLNSRAVQERPGAPLGREDLLAGRIGDHARDQFTRLLQSKRHIISRKPVGEVGGSIQGIHVPAKFWRAVVSPALFGNDRMRRKVRAEPIHNQFLAGTVGGGDQVMFALELEPDVPPGEVAQ